MQYPQTSVKVRATMETPPAERRSRLVEKLARANAFPVIEFGMLKALASDAGVENWKTLILRCLPTEDTFVYLDEVVTTLASWSDWNIHAYLNEAGRTIFDDCLSMLNCLKGKTEPSKEDVGKLKGSPFMEKVSHGGCNLH